MGIVLVIALFGALFVTDNQEFFDKAAKDIEDGNRWHFVGAWDAVPYVISLAFCVVGH